MNLPKLKKWEVKQSDAVASARTASEKFGLPQTVFRAADTFGWSHTHPLADRLRKANEVFVTVLPKGFFA